MPVVPCTAQWGARCSCDVPSQHRPCYGAGEGAGCGFRGCHVGDPGHLLLTPGFAICLGLSPTSPCRKGRKKVAPDGVKLVDEVRAHFGGRISSEGGLGSQPSLRVSVPPWQALLCQTQLRSLSKSDTKLHELYRVKVRDDGEWPWSRGSPTAGGLWQLPTVPLLPREYIMSRTDVTRCWHCAGTGVGACCIPSFPLLSHSPASGQPGSPLSHSPWRGIPAQLWPPAP